MAKKKAARHKRKSYKFKAKRNITRSEWAAVKAQKKIEKKQEEAVARGRRGHKVVIRKVLKK